jgi:ElaB/YqjD/DUF883 family membrane-anchored ribosome-binding protein
MNRYQIPEAVRHDVRALAEDAQALIEATAEIADKKVAQARQRLAGALDHGRDLYSGMREKVVRGAKVTDDTVRDYPYQSMAVAFAAGALLGLLFSRRD